MYKDQADHSHDQGEDKEEKTLIEMSDCTVYLLVKCTKTRLTTVMTRVRMRKDRLIEMSDCTVYLLVKCTKTRLTTVMTRVRMRKRRGSLRCLTVQYTCK